ncbi:hypothetical protein BH10PSE17_BH10PSE17_31380 [soil metagenome]
MHAIALAIGMMGGVSAQAAGNVDAVVDYEVRQVTSSGVTRVERWQERLVRRDDVVWIERVLPAGSSRAHDEESSAEHIGHKHFNGETAARWITRSPDGKLDVQFVDREHQVIVAIPRAEYGTVGFDGSFDGAGSIVPPAAAHAMRRSRDAATADAQWLVDRRNGWTHRVLWSESRQLALRVESRRDDGAAERKVSVRTVAAGAKAPWQQLQGYEQKRYDDFGD